MTKKQKTERCREILHAHKPGEAVTNADDIDFLLSVFEGHSEWDTKQGAGVRSISVMRNQYNKCFQINRVDGSSTDISFVHSITNRTPLADIRKACRDAIRPDVVQYRKENVVYGVTTCPITGETLTEANTHIDHYDLPFDAMFRLWAERYDVAYLHARVNESADNSVVTRFTDPELVNDFRQFHAQHSRLRAVSQSANLSILKRNKA
jgi:hypothetical protein